MSDAPAGLDAALAATWEHLRARRWDAALDALPTVEDPARPGAMTRIHAFRAQALYELGRMADADRSVTIALRWARAEPGQPGLASVRGLQARILASLATQQVAERERRADAALVERADDALAAEPDGWALRVRKAHVLADLGRADDAARTAEPVWSQAQAPLRERILAALILARCTGDAARWIHAAHAEADAADDTNLLTAVAHAARSAGVTLRLLA